jgi:hypothetical protein
MEMILKKKTKRTLTELGFGLNTRLKCFINRQFLRTFQQYILRHCSSAHALSRDFYPSLQAIESRPPSVVAMALRRLYPSKPHCRTYREFEKVS